MTQYIPKIKLVLPDATSYFLVTFFVLFSGGTATYGMIPYWMVVAMPLAIFYAIKKKQMPNTTELIFLIFSFFVFFAQFIYFHKSIIFLIRPISLLLVMYISARILRRTFTIALVNVMYFFAICSLLLFLVDIFGGRPLLLATSDILPQLGATAFSDNVGTMHTLYLYNINDVLSMNGYMRNAGPFWEPGRFAIFLNIALALNTFRSEGRLFSKKNIIFVITILTTFSTTGYIALLCVLAGNILCSSRSSVLKILLVTLLIPLMYYMISLDFMQDKVISEMSDFDVESSRFGAMAYHWLQIKESPFIGYGPYLSAVYGEAMLSPNGWSELVRYFGFPLSIFMFFSLFFSAPAIISLDRYRALKQIFIFLVIIIVAFAQTVMFSPFYYLLYFFALSGMDFKRNGNILMYVKRSE